jgi:PAS domain-containing protein
MPGRASTLRPPLHPDRNTQIADVELAIAQANLASLDAHFQATIEQLPIGIAHADVHDRITRFNTAFCTMLGRSAEELLGKHFAEITYSDDKDGSAAAI